MDVQDIYQLLELTKEEQKMLMNFTNNNIQNLKMKDRENT